MQLLARAWRYVRNSSRLNASAQRGVVAFGNHRLAKQFFFLPLTRACEMLKKPSVSSAMISQCFTRPAFCVFSAPHHTYKVL